MYNKQPLENDRYFHIYNRGINSSRIFSKENDYLYFLHLYQKYSIPVMETLAWVLIPNHYHFLVRIKVEKEIPFVKSNKISDDTKKKKLIPHIQLGHLFNTYSKSYNKNNNRTGALFEKPFKRVIIENQEYLNYLVYYIHNNPVHHGISKTISAYKWSSFNTITSNKPTKLNRESTLDLFNGKQGFINFHNKENDCNEIRGLLIEK